MTETELIAAAALGASALTALASLGVVGLQEWLRGNAAFLALSLIWRRPLQFSFQSSALCNDLADDGHHVFLA